MKIINPIATAIENEQILNMAEFKENELRVVKSQ